MEIGNHCLEMLELITHSDDLCRQVSVHFPKPDIEYGSVNDLYWCYHDKQTILDNLW